MLDVGATINADAQQLIDFAMMGGAMARALLDVEPDGGAAQYRRRGDEGLEEVRVAGQLLKEANLKQLVMSASSRATISAAVRSTSS